MKRLGLASLGILVAVGLCEIALRGFWHNPYRHEKPDSILKIHMNHANTDHVYNRRMLDGENQMIRLRTDDRGYILPSFRPGDPDITIAFLGGSTTECPAAREELRFPALVATLFEKEGIRVDSLNAARSGNNVQDSLNVLSNQVVHDRPDAVVLMHAANDVGMLTLDGGYRSRMGKPVSIDDLGKWTMQLASSRSYLAGIVRSLASSATRRHRMNENRIATPLAEDLPVEPYQYRLKAFVHICRDFEIWPVLMTQPMSEVTTEFTPYWTNRKNQEVMNGIIRQVAREEQVTIVDLAKHFQDHVEDVAQSREILYDGLHSTDKGCRFFSQHIFATLLPVIRDLVSLKTSRPTQNTP